jgi:hypothetical protein
LTNDVYGYERQPFISEVFSRVANLDDGKGNFTSTQQFSAVELCNPYDQPIVVENWQLMGAVYGAPVTLPPGATVPARALETATGTWRPGRLIIATTGTPGAPGTPTGGVTGVKEGGNATWFSPPAGFQFDQGSSGGLQLQRSITAGGSGGTYVVVDSVDDAAMQSVLGKNTNAPAQNRARDYSIERGIYAWRFARNKFDHRESRDFLVTGGTPTPDWNGLGRWVSKPHPCDLADPTLPLSATNLPTPPGVSLPVADRVLASATASVNVQGWFEVGRPTFIGNGTTSASAITNAVSTYVTHLAPYAEEGNVRFNLAEPTPVLADEWKNKARRLFEVMGFFARCDDGYDNESGTTATGVEKLMECRIPGRINVNTAPEGVLRALFPALAQPLPDPDMTVTPSEWASCLDLMAGWFAKAVVYERNANGPFVGLDDFANRLDNFSNPIVTGTQGVIPELPANQVRVMRIGWLARAAIQETVKKKTIVRNVGDPFMGYSGSASGGTYDSLSDYSDFEERDWLFGRMANLLTVRSDTFTAYILIQIQNAANSSDFSKRRLIAIFDRSNVFLPAGLARNNVDNSGDLPVGTTSDDRDRLYVTPKVVAVQVVGDVD